MDKFIPQMEPDFDHLEAEACYQYMLSGGYVTEFRKTSELEQMIKDYTNAKHCFMVNNGTVSLSLALLALGVKAGDNVIVPNFTMIATPNSVRLIGANPVLVDVSEQDLTIDLECLVDVAKEYNPKVIVHVSLNGRCHDLVELRQYCDRNGIGLLEDSAQSLGIFHNGKHLGRYGHIGSFSFSSPKIISTGQGGALITDDDVLAEKIRTLKDFGRDAGGCDSHSHFGINSKFTDIQAVIGIEQMKKLPGRVIRKKEIWERYYSRLSNVVDMVKYESEGWIPWFVDIYVDDPKDLSRYLKQKNVGTRLVYPPINNQVTCQDLDYCGGDITEKWSKRGLWLPSSTKLSNEQIDYVCDVICEYYVRS